MTRKSRMNMDRALAEAGRKAREASFDRACHRYAERAALAADRAGKVA